MSASCCLCSEPIAEDSSPESSVVYGKYTMHQECVLWCKYSALRSLDLSGKHASVSGKHEATPLNSYATPSHGKQLTLYRVADMKTRSVDLALNQILKQQCSLCQRTGAFTGCNKCEKSFHLQCAMKDGDIVKETGANVLGGIKSVPHWKSKFTLLELTALRKSVVDGNQV